MSFFDILKGSLSTLKTNKLRTLLTMLGIIIGISSVIAMWAIGNGGRDSILGDLKKVGYGKFTVNINYKNENFENDGKTSQESYSDTNIDKIRGFFKEFIVSVRLDVKIVNVKKENNGKYLVVLDGKDMRFLIGEKGSALNSLEYLISTTKKFKHLKISVDSNNYKEKREKSLRDLARKKGKKVLDSGRNVKLNPMSARERKIIHEEISFIKGLKTESVGEEPKRYLVIKRIKD